MCTQKTDLMAFYSNLSKNILFIYLLFASIFWLMWALALYTYTEYPFKLKHKQHINVSKYHCELVMCVHVNIIRATQVIKNSKCHLKLILWIFGFFWLTWLLDNFASHWDDFKNLPFLFVVYVPSEIGRLTYL